jgi:hypothetical protein
VQAVTGPALDAEGVMAGRQARGRDRSQAIS